MAEFHVACGGSAIFAGIANEEMNGFTESSDVTGEALCAVRDLLMFMRPDSKEQIGYRWIKDGGGSVSIILVETDEDTEEPDEPEQEQSELG